VAGRHNPEYLLVQYTAGGTLLTRLCQEYLREPRTPAKYQLVEVFLVRTSEYSSKGCPAAQNISGWLGERSGELKRMARERSRRRRDRI